MRSRIGANVHTGSSLAKASTPQRPLGRGPDVGPTAIPHLVVILSYGDPSRAIQCAASIRDGSDSPGPHLLIVRNHSDTPDGDLPDYVADLPDADFLALRTNCGFSGGMNAGLQWGVDHGFETLTVLNDDTIASRDALDQLAMAAQHDPHSAVCPRIEYLPPRAAPWFVGGTRDLVDGLPRHLTTEEFKELPRPSGAAVRVGFVTGCCITASAAAWLATGGFDERYFLYFEDSDWSAHADQVGLQLQVHDAVQIHHMVSASSIGSAAYLTSFYYSRNLLLFASTWPLSGVSPWRTWQRRSVRPAIRTVKRHPATGIGHLIMVSLGAGAWILRRTGPAPDAVVRAADRWVSASSARAR